VLDSLLASGLAIRVAVVPAPHDPDSFIKEKGGPAFQELIDKAQGFFDYYLGRLCTSNDIATDKGRLAVLVNMAEAVLKTGNAVMTDTYAQKTAHRLGVAPEAVRVEFKKRAGNAKKTGPSAAPDSEPAAEMVEAPQPTPERELWLLRFLLATEEHLDWVARHLDLNWLQHGVVRQVISVRLGAHTEQTWRGVAALLHECQDDPMRRLITSAMATEQSMNDFPKKIAQTVQLLRNDWIDRRLAELNRRLAQAGAPDAEIERQKIELRLLRRQPLPT
jgi:DNA primase